VLTKSTNFVNFRFIANFEIDNRNIQFFPFRRCFRGFCFFPYNFSSESLVLLIRFRVFFRSVILFSSLNDLGIYVLLQDDKIQDVLGHFQKDFEGGVSAENLGKFFIRATIHIT
jgi:hypothetical protein